MPDARSLPDPRHTLLTDLANVLALVTAHNGPRLLRGLPPRRDRAHIQAALEGATVRLSPPGLVHSNNRVGGGLRGEVRGFSRQSRNRLLRMVGSINRKEFAPGQAMFVTLTYHRSWPTDPQQQYQHLRAFHKRLQRRWGPLPLIWRKEWQSRGAPHFHLILFAPLSSVVEVGQEWPFADDVTSAWVEIASSKGDSLVHMYRHAVDLKVCDSWKATMAYAAKHMRYISKDEALLPCDENGEVLPTGRIWGTLQRDHLPISYQTTTITFKEYLQLRRYFRRMKRPQTGRQHRRKIPKSDLTNEHVLMGFGEVNRLLAWLGYYRD